MDDIRRPHQPQRRDYTTPPHRPAPSPHPAADFQPAQPATVHHEHASAHPHHQPPAYAQAQHHAAAASPKKRRRSGLKIVLIILLPLIAAAIFAAGYSFKSSKDANTIPASITKEAKFDLYFPSPMPAGYMYMKNTATFQIGQVFYRFSNGNKRVTVNEQPLGPNRPKLDELPGYTKFDSAVGQAAIGSTFGQPTAVVITGTTVITLNSTGGVSPDDLKTAVNNLKNIGQNTDHKS